jgi:hypothetical protein
MDLPSRVFRMVRNELLDDRQRSQITGTRLRRSLSLCCGLADQVVAGPEIMLQLGVSGIRSREPLRDGGIPAVGFERFIEPIEGGEQVGHAVEIGG